MQPALSMISHVEFTECKVVHEKLKYKGIVDCVAVFKFVHFGYVKFSEKCRPLTFEIFVQFRDKLVLIDWKKSDKPKTTISMTYDAPLQIAAYIGAINYDSSYPFKVSNVGCLYKITATRITRC